ncbi:hypothetical protein ABZ442_01290 [Streptomyces triculaminicus]|uniref:hypothetical protein n=1 Tax=Streptomyces triculaminicus TaxID=2816232 RepID=UPI0033CD0206
MSYFGLRRSMRLRISATWPTALFGIHYSASGVLRCRPAPELRERGRGVVRSVARQALEDIARPITGTHMPSALDEAQNVLALRLSEWGPVAEGSATEIRARITLRLASDDRARSQAYDDARREQQLRHHLNVDRISYLRSEVLVSADAARAWWIDLHRDGDRPISWEEFNTHVLPYVGNAQDPQSQAMRAAVVLAQVMERLDSDPGRHQQFRATTRVVLQQMGWEDLADEL